jgi:hypothetical protein
MQILLKVERPQVVQGDRSKFHLFPYLNQFNQFSNNLLLLRQ